MSPIFDWLFQQYEAVPRHIVILEIIAVILALASAWFSKMDNILIYPTGILSTAIFVYILAYYGLLGDLIINAYYFSMSIYGWYIWTRKVDAEHYTPITITTPKEKKISLLIFVATLLFIYIIYEIFEKWTSWTAYVDTLTTALFFVAMWLLARKKLENWLFLLVGNVISIPLYFYKGLIFTSFQFMLFVVISIYGYRAWKRNLNIPETSLLN
ncbi:nicotinamide riboside transporter PnuC [Aequorivita vladivostokensis]|uniref:Nicotinamide riboside transporter PnuC n=1 Tax=Aequorivita vladivostokensis TaxID=171194 RepID=A0ABR5DG03_9FLAO|nr:nicotinamide riboside transporter PnuC [Aequorivita vladivostokensis]MAB56823.1 nicotinamide riboside transporter PnuC [Aequorivita sp.]KJJ37684.1 nicotinamide mononucleotide transporter [Aequorivita vladivostokensis]MAO47839.1 nicotinamide riboside transporter PnuC [Aequorivita sp.]MBF31614.1 nicotinamide riboside transporter PnuC [Aequorivita sp.]HAV53324.1 nicotinamide riboside transporter PnuC [Aequorivita sp.]|tara:strand:- start:61502 stop:62140 length:639 start_codon:yes stop_codon:yes gene_type:complete